MTKKSIVVIVLVLLLAGLSLYLNWDRFQSEPLRIGSRSVPPRGGMFRRDQKSPTNPVIFFFNRSLKLTSVKVIPVNDIETNKYPLAIWQLVSDSNSAPVKDVIYGLNVRGMKPSVKGAVAGELQPGAKYRLYIETASEKAEHDFSPVQRMP